MTCVAPASGEVVVKATLDTAELDVVGSETVIGEVANEADTKRSPVWTAVGLTTPFTVTSI